MTKAVIGERVRLCGARRRLCRDGERGRCSDQGRLVPPSDPMGQDLIQPSVACPLYLLLNTRIPAASGLFGVRPFRLDQGS